MQLYQTNQSIEAENCIVKSRKIVPSQPFKDDILGLCMKYNCDRNSYAIITKELVPKVFKIKETSFLNLDDKISGDAITIITVHLRRINPYLENNSHTHKIMVIDIKKFTFAEIKIPFEHIINALNKRLL